MLATKWSSWCAGTIAKGCAQCVQGRKLVLFVTGLCAQRCFYCPISEQRYGKDVVFANEWKVSDPENPTELFEEARLTEAHGAGITGGDPLVMVDRCCTYIRLLKERFGERFHIHLYTPLKLVTAERLHQLYDAGLDEIRFHPDLDDRILWPVLGLAKQFPWKIGVEIPAIPGYEKKIQSLIDFIAGKVDFLNLNELELSDTQTHHYKLAELGYPPKDEYSYGAAGSQETGRQLLGYAEAKGVNVHFCTAKLKDNVQVRKRLQLRAKHVALPFDIPTAEGTLIRGCAYVAELAPGMKYQDRLATADKDALLRKLKQAREILKIGIIDNQRYRLLMPRQQVKRLAKKLTALGLKPAIVEEYPTADGLELDVQFF
ncbi:radical SAM protein [Candidatus Woesearchaeota archaeon]|nr:radical SAM protein [Candidatus Woesearchaeota archaeon]